MKKILLYICIAAMVAACAKSDFEEAAGDGGAVQFTTTSQVTRSVEKSDWSSGETIGIYTESKYTNVEYVATKEDGSSDVTFSPVSDIVCYTSWTSATTFYAYYPYNDKVTDSSVPIDLSTSQEDILWSKATSSASDTTPKVEFTFDHLLTLINIEVTFKGDFKTKDDLCLFIGGTHTSGTMNVCAESVAQALTVAETVDYDVETEVEVTDGKYVASAVVMPFSSYATDAVTIYFEVDDRAFYKTFTPSWTQGKSYTYSAVLGNEDVEFKLNSIEDWGTEVESDVLLSGYDLVIDSNGKCQIYSGKGLAAFRDIVNGAESNSSGAIVQNNCETTAYEEFTTEKYPSLSAELMNDVYIGDLGSWAPIGNGSNQYRGTFTGNNYEVQGLYINNGDDYQGLFGYIYDSATITGVGVIGSVAGGGKVGGLVGCAENSTISNCYSNVTVSGGSSVGGLVGNNYSATIYNCYNLGSVSATGSKVGGLVGENQSTIYNCYNMGNVSGTTYVGGFVGDNSDGTITNCYSAAVVCGSGANIGGFVGYDDGRTYVECYYNVTYFGGYGCGNDSTKSGIAGYSTSEMTGEEFLGKLNTKADDFTNACDWVKGDDGYPTLQFDTNL